MPKKQEKKKSASEDEESPPSFQPLSNFLGMFGGGRSASNVNCTKLDEDIVNCHAAHGLYWEHLKKVISYVEYMTRVTPTCALPNPEGKGRQMEPKKWTIYNFLQDAAESEALVIYPRCRLSADESGVEKLLLLEKTAGVESILYERLAHHHRTFRESAAKTTLRTLAWYVNNIFMEEREELGELKKSLEEVNKLERRSAREKKKEKAQVVRKDLEGALAVFKKRLTTFTSRYLDNFDHQIKRNRQARHRLLTVLLQYHRGMAEEMEKSLGKVNIVQLNLTKGKSS